MFTKYQHTLQILSNNVTYIIEGVFSWILTIFGLNTMNYSTLSDLTTALDFVKAVLSLVALVLACSVSALTLYKIRRDLKQ